MPRMARVVLPNYPHHVVQRGHNRQAVFVDDYAYRRYLQDLCDLKQLFEVRVYAYCLMTNHVHLLLAPSESAAMGKLMKRLAARATRYRNKREGRTGTLWEGRYKSIPVQTDRYLLACNRYIELNPVRAGMVDMPEAYPWSSYRQRLGLEKDIWIDEDPAFLSLAATPENRRQRYQELVMEGIPDAELSLISQAVQRGQLTGGDRFGDEVEHLIGWRVESRAQGRPGKSSQGD